MYCCSKQHPTVNHPQQCCLLLYPQAAVQVRAEKKVRVAINGFGRIGRNFLRCLETRQNR